MTNPEIIVERKKYGSSAMDYTMRVYQKLDKETIMIDGVKYKRVEEPKSKTLTDLITRWWNDTFVTHTSWGAKTSIADLVDQIELWLPKEHDTNSDGWNKCVRMIRENLR